VFAVPFNPEKLQVTGTPVVDRSGNVKLLRPETFILGGWPLGAMSLSYVLSVGEPICGENPPRERRRSLFKIHTISNPCCAAWALVCEIRREILRVSFLCIRWVI
jgi:hypothetical protein